MKHSFLSKKALVFALTTSIATPHAALATSPTTARAPSSTCSASVESQTLESFANTNLDKAISDIEKVILQAEEKKGFVTKAATVSAIMPTLYFLQSMSHQAVKPGSERIVYGAVAVVTLASAISIHANNKALITDAQAFLAELKKVRDSGVSLDCFAQENISLIDKAKKKRAELAVQAAYIGQMLVSPEHEKYVVIGGAALAAVTSVAVENIAMSLGAGRHLDKAVQGLFVAGGLYFAYNGIKAYAEKKTLKEMKVKVEGQIAQLEKQIKVLEVLEKSAKK